MAQAHTLALVHLGTEGLVLDQGFRNELMPKKLSDVKILALNESLEMEDTAVNTFMTVADAEAAGFRRTFKWFGNK